jgi:hypothetical protein
LSVTGWKSEAPSSVKEHLVRESGRGLVKLSSTWKSSPGFTSWGAYIKEKCVKLYTKGKPLK